MLCPVTYNHKKLTYFDYNYSWYGYVVSDMRLQKDFTGMPKGEC